MYIDKIYKLFLNATSVYSHSLRKLKVYAKKHPAHFYAVAAVLLIGSIAAANSFHKRQGIRGSATGAANLSLPFSGSPQIGEQFNVPVILDTGGADTNGVDVVINFDPTAMTLSSIDPYTIFNPLKLFTPVNVSQTFDAEGVVGIANSEGRIEFGAVAYDLIAQLPSTNYNGTMALANLSFTALKEGTHTISFLFTPNLNTDSNVVSAGDTAFDLLSTVTNGNVSILAPTTTPTPTLTPTLITTPSPTPTVSTTLTIASPANNTVVKTNSIVVISANVVEGIPGNVASVKFLVNGNVVCTDTATPYSCSWKVPGKKNATYKLIAEAYNASGVKVASSTTVVVNTGATATNANTNR